jgi:acetolactate synthase-1/2/3 large subunit/sulfoacetaldehyde acetyltransferase
MSAGRAVIELLKAEGVRHVFGIVGSTFLDVLDVLYDDKSVTYVNVRHEQGGAFMADGLARVTGAPAVCLVTSGPGATNLVTGIAGAYVAHSPVVAIAGGAALAQQGRDAFQELDLVGLFRPVTKLSVQVTQPSRIPDMLRLAFRTAMSGRKGPVFVDIPRDVLNDQVVSTDPLAPETYRASHPAPPHPDAVQEVARLLARAARPLLVAGGGVTWAGASELVARLSTGHGLPSITAYGRNDAVANRDPLYVGPLGRAGAPEAAEACRRADLLLVVGSRLGQFTSFYDGRYIQPGTPIVQVDIDPRDIGRVYPVAVGIQADARETLAALLAALGEARIPPVAQAWQREIQALRARRQARLLAEATLDGVPVKPQRVYAELRRALPPDTIVTLDAGAAPAYGYDRLHFDRPRTFLTPLDLGSLGFAFPAALGAKLGRPEAPALAIHGDGGFLMNAQELETAVRHGIPAVALVMNNNCWGSEKAYQRHFYHGRYVGTDIGNPRYDRFAELFGARGYYVERPDQIVDAVRAALGAGQPAVVEIPIDPDEFPTPATTARRRDG